jgi:hypothetical protein
VRRIPVESSLARSVGHGPSIMNPRLPAIEIEMSKSGKVYQYEGVTVDQYVNAMRADSIGKALLVFINAKVDGVPVYPCTEITPELLERIETKNSVKEDQNIGKSS